MKSSWQPGPDSTCDLVKRLHVRWVWAAGCLVLRSSRSKRLERHGLTLQAPLAALAAGSAAPLSRGGGGLHHGCGY